MITSLAYVVFWLSSVAALISSLTVLYRLDSLPYWVAALLCLLVGAAFGIAMVECFVRLHGINERFEQEPVNGATGAQITFLDLFMPYIQFGLLSAFALPSIIGKRRQKGLPISTVPDWAIYLPVVLALLMAAAVIWSQITKKRLKASS
jgi:hypothetical protein